MARIPAVRQAQAALAANTRQRLREFGMSNPQLAELERTSKAESRLTIYAPQRGTVVEKLAVAGSYVKAGDPIYRIAELSTDLRLLFESVIQELRQLGRHGEAAWG